MTGEAIRGRFDSTKPRIYDKERDRGKVAKIQCMWVVISFRLLHF